VGKEGQKTKRWIESEKIRKGEGMKRKNKKQQKSQGTEEREREKRQVDGRQRGRP
jgi:hypothetical protein